jgi:hypothetical protein
MGHYRGVKTNFRVRTAYARKVISRKLVDTATVPVDAANVQFKKSIAGICVLCNLAAFLASFAAMSL